MDRRRRICSLIGLAWIAGSAAALPAASQLREARWIAQEHRLEALLTEPAECVIQPANAEGANRLAIGRAAFRSSLLLGGQAARAGLSCDSCHRNGRGNPHFQFPGLSAEPGTADVTSSVLSSHRNDRTFNPVAIPDLSGPAKLLKVKGSKPAAELRSFIRGLIVEEFDGSEPSALTLDSISLYIDLLSSDACPSATNGMPSLLRYRMKDSQESAKAAIFALEANDREAARLMLASTRESLGLIHERYSAPGLAPDRSLLRGADKELAEIQEGIEAGRKDAKRRIQAWLNGVATWSGTLAADEEKSLFNQSRLQQILKAQITNHKKSTAVSSQSVSK